MKILIVSAKKLRRLLAEIINEKIQVLLKEVPMSQINSRNSAFEPVYLTTKQALSYLHISKPTLNKLRREGLVLGLHVSDNRVLYEKKQLDYYIKHHPADLNDK
ncbi:DNA-binding protein [Hymenobacter aquaticus]|uniref:DNA-binding protein n=1 Tax=Hymenobacter aquaticus TaxID=1867101 RepID=A0A4Z0Q567_9BACT|nr:helix-turn-helix domain-containing protein [Hymenobacter aquaticus]TGE25200.1 DNA-binding protein [Hymenobacter aquaticus]